MLIDRIENLIKGTKEEKVMKNLLYGVFANEFIPKGKNKIMNNVQSRTRFNQIVSEDLQPFVNVLNLKVKEASKEGVYKKNQVIKECKFTGKLESVKKRGRYNHRFQEDLPF